MWEENYVEIMCLERAYLDNSGAFPVFSASGTFSGHGQIDGQKFRLLALGLVSYSHLLLWCWTVRVQYASWVTEPSHAVSSQPLKQPIFLFVFRSKT